MIIPCRGRSHQLLSTLLARDEKWGRGSEGKDGARRKRYFNGNKSCLACVCVWCVRVWERRSVSMGVRVCA